MPPPAIQPQATRRPSPTRPSRWSRRLYVAACLTAIALALYLTTMKLTGRISDLSGCGGEGGCASLLGGRWANWLRIPISLWALLVYVPLLILGIIGFTTPWRRRLAFAGTSVLLAAAAWFFFIQAVIERAFCPFCAVLHGCGLIAFTCALGAIWSQDLPERVAALLAAAGAGTISMIALVTGQLYGPQPATHEITIEQDLPEPAATAGHVTPTADPTAPSAGVVPAARPSAAAGQGVAGVAGETTDRPAPALPSDPLAISGDERVATYFDGAITIPVAKVPLIGRPEARHILLKYFDYTCATCRRMHDDLETAIAAYPDDLAVIVLPCPLNRSCNPYAEESSASSPGPNSHEHACELARLALAVWRADPTKFPQFHDELFARQGRMTPTAARIVAEAMVGESALRASQADPWIEAILKHSCGIYGRMKKRNPRMPKLLLGGRQVLHGAVIDSRVFLQVLRQQLRLPAIPPAG